jgi:signal peptidase II
MFGLAAVIVLLIDRLSKDWIVQNMQLGETIPLLSPILSITRSFNTGAAFGIGGEIGNVFLVLAVLISGVLVYYVASSDENARLEQFAYGLIFGGAMGNVIDRIQQGQVVDFVHIVIPGLISNVSNFADHAIVLGVIVLLVDTFRRDFLAKKAAEPVAPVEETPHE